MEFHVSCNFHFSQTDTKSSEVKIPLNEMQLHSLPLSYIKRIAMNQMRRQNPESGLSEYDGAEDKIDAVACYSREENRWYADDCVCLTDICPGHPIKTLELVLRNYMPPPTLDVTIFGTQNCASDLLMSFYTSYRIRVTFGKMTWQVSRRYREFDHLHCLLKEKYGEAFSFALSDSTVSYLGKAIVKFPPKQIFGRLESDTIDRRRVMLEDYLQRLLHAPKPPTLSQDVLILSFLGIVSTQKLSNKSVGSDSINIDALDKQIDFGDILLFSCRFGSSICQRKFTGSRFDHVGIVIPGLRGGNLRLLEATGEGIRVYPLIARIKTYAREVTERIVVRSFLVKRDPESARCLLAFVNSVDGNAYSFLSIFQGLNKSDRCVQQKQLYDEEKWSQAFVSPLQNFTTQSVEIAKSVVASQKTKQSPHKRRKYFCSSLVASALKELGWLQTKRSCSYFWPGSFEEHGEIERSLHPGTTLGKEIDIDCRPVEVATATFTS
uniref:Ribonuclease H2 subunit A putative n=1 Tax=Albugo laibachii Nc14 TaxID=890382 RepID=F0WJL3_9STRA|nr:ribonuclease H2 subunit A putative [Albugo laibachii Nc14]|eukprot:CCA21462.1 ribonuclease H2 subunit A putative [Albugo laibachii Nc14]